MVYFAGSLKSTGGAITSYSSHPYSDKIIRKFFSSSKSILSLELSVYVTVNSPPVKSKSS